MTITSTHQLDPLGGWDIAVTINSDKDEVIASVRIELSGFSVFGERLDPPSNTWIRVFPQKGRYPGKNKLVITAQNQEEKDCVYTEEWES